MVMPDTPQLRHLFDMHVDLEPAQAIASPEVSRMVFVARGGTVSGDRIEGEVLPGGGDWLRVGTDGVGRIDVRATLRTHDGELVLLTNTGVIAIAGEALERFGAGQSLRWDELHARSAPQFETGAEQYAWLNSVSTVAVHGLGPTHVDYRVWEVL
jgi:hypothetical protein